jgi:hypothetical protein
MNGRKSTCRSWVQPPLAILLVFLLRSPLFACPVCFQVEQSPATDGLQAAVLVLMGVTAAVLSGLATFIFRFARRS